LLLLNNPTHRAIYDAILVSKINYTNKISDLLHTNVHLNQKLWWKNIKRASHQNHPKPFILYKTALLLSLNADSNLSEIHITAADIEAILTSLDVTKSVGPDLVHPKLLKEAASALSIPLHKLFNLSLNISKFPSSWKLAHVTPVYKNGDLTSVKNYRAISLLSILNKVMEKCILKHVHDYPINNHIITPYIITNLVLLLVTPQQIN